MNTWWLLVISAITHFHRNIKPYLHFWSAAWKREYYCYCCWHEHSTSDTQSHFECHDLAYVFTRDGRISDLVSGSGWINTIRRNLHPDGLHVLYWIRLLQSVNAACELSDWCWADSLYTAGVSRSMTRISLFLGVCGIVNKASNCVGIWHVHWTVARSRAAGEEHVLSG